METKPLLTLVIPAFNEEACIPLLLDQLNQLRESITVCTTQVIFVDDHSSDETPALLKKAAAESEGMHYIRLTRRRGSHIAILAGLKESKADVYVFLAADLQDPPELIHELIKKWDAGSKVVWAVRSKREKAPLLEVMCSKLFYRLMNKMSDVTYPPEGSDFALLDQEVVQSLLQSLTATPSLGGDIARLGYPQAFVSYEKKARASGISKWTFWNKIRAFIEAMVSFSYIPMRLMSLVGLLVSAVGFLYAIVIIIMRISMKTQPSGWASLMVVVLVIGGLQMVMLGILGEYLWRALEESRRRPLYFIEDRD